MMWRVPWPRCRWPTGSIYDIGIGVDDKNPDNYSLNLNQSGLGLPDQRILSARIDKALAEDPPGICQVSRRHDGAGGHERYGGARQPRHGAGNRNRQSLNGTAPTAATRTKSTIP